MSEQKQPSDTGYLPPTELIEAFDITKITPKELPAVKINSPQQ